MASAKKNSSTKDGKSKIIGDSKYPLVHLHSIELAERPEEGEEHSQLFYNPRSLESFDSNAMTELRESIKIDGLQQPPIVRVFTKDGTKDGEITCIQLIAGERRYRSICKLFQDNAECYDEDTGAMVDARKLYEFVPCKVLFNIDDQTALRIAFKENNEHKSLTIKEEIALVERLTSMGMKQEEISDLLGTNVTWVSQTSNFRRELPDGAFDKLMDGKLSRHVAVQILSFRPQDRDRLYTEALKAEEKERAEALAKAKSELEFAEDEEDIAFNEQDQAARKGDVIAAKKAKKKAAAAKKKIEQAKDKADKIGDGEGVIKQGHISKGGQQAGIAPKKVKMLPRPTVEQFYIDLLNNWIEKGDKTDSVLGYALPVYVLKIMQMTAQAILNGQHDPATALRNFMVQQGDWAVPDGVSLPAAEVWDFEEAAEAAA